MEKWPPVLTRSYSSKKIFGAVACASTLACDMKKHPDGHVLSGGNSHMMRKPRLASRACSLLVFR
jgi:hypothetical protein